MKTEQLRVLFEAHYKKHNAKYGVERYRFERVGTSRKGYLFWDTELEWQAWQNCAKAIAKAGEAK